MSEYMRVTNPGSAIGEAIGTSMEKALAEKLSEVADLHGYHYLGEIKVFEFDNLENAIDFLAQDDLKSLFLMTDSLSLFDPSPIFDD